MAVLNAVGPLNEFLCDLHGPTANIARTMRRLVPFSDDIGSLPDADVLDLSVSVALEADQIANAEPTANVHVKVRYATSARISQAHTFYVAEFERVGATIIESVSPIDGRGFVIDAVLTDSRQTTYHVAVDRCRGYRSVTVSVSYGGFDHHELFARFAEWHNGDAPVTSECMATGLEISTFSSGRRPSTVVLYSTHYSCPQTPHGARRAMVDLRIDELGWTYREPREGIMFIQGSMFDAETHVYGDDSSSNVTFVGEFQLR